jgi:prepilin-type N-terminal cleavage/methylation domain-containing protein
MNEMGLKDRRRGKNMGILKQKGVKELNMAMGIKRKKGFSLVELIIATSIITFIIFAVMEVYYVNKKAEEQNQISYMIDESISEIVPIELLKIPANVRNGNNPEQVAQRLVTHLNGMEDSIKGKINNDLKNFDKQSEIKDINFSYITERKNENIVKIDSQNKAVKTYIKVEYSYKTKYSTRKKIIKLPIYSYYNDWYEGFGNPEDPREGHYNPRDSVSLSVDGD